MLKLKKPYVQYNPSENRICFRTTTTSFDPVNHCLGWAAVLCHLIYTRIQSRYHEFQMETASPHSVSTNRLTGSQKRFGNVISFAFVESKTSVWTVTAGAVLLQSIGYGTIEGCATILSTFCY